MARKRFHDHIWQFVAFGFMPSERASFICECGALKWEKVEEEETWLERQS